VDDDKTQRDQIEKEHDVLVAENAIRMYEKKVKGLYREGEKIFSDAEHEALEQRYLQELSGAMNAQIGVAEKRQASAEEELRALSYYDPVASLSAGERDRLSTSAQFIKEDAQTLSLPDLKARLTAVASSANDDKASKLLHARYAKRRVQEHEDAATEGGLGQDDQAALARISRLVDELEAQVEDEGIRQKREKAAMKAERAKETVWHLKGRLQDVDGTSERVMEESWQHILSVLNAAENAPIDFCGDC
jgi:hypothetical protein